MDDVLEEDERAQGEDLCRVTEIGGTGIEWICIKKVHSKQYKRKGRYGVTWSLGSEHHYFVRRYPDRDKNDD